MKDIHSQLEEHSQGYYLNFVNFENAEVAEGTQWSFPPANWARVQAAKAAYDPFNMFRELIFYHTVMAMVQMMLVMQAYRLLEANPSWCSHS